jgi:hypothetical protein
VGIITTVVLATVLSWLLVYVFLPSDPRDPLTKAGRPVATFEVKTVSEAQSLLKESWLREDLASLKSGGVPLLAPNAKMSVRRRPSTKL